MSGKIGVLGGVFDPVHNGHLAVASLARDYFKLDTFLFVPSGNPPHKQCLPASDRLEMLKLAIQNEPGVSLWEGEIKRPGQSYTIDTLVELKKIFKQQICFVIGSDNLQDILHWKNYQEIIRMVTLCIAHRPGYTCDIPENLSQTGTAVVFPSPEWGISSSMIRTYLQNGLTCRHLLPEPVITYIKEHNLYNR